MSNRIQSMLEEENSVTLFQKVRLDIKDNLRRHEYDSAVVNSVRLFEVWVKTAYIALEAIKNDEEEEARRIATNTSLIPLVTQNLNSHLDGDIEDYKEWKDWDDGAYDARKDTIHEGRQVPEDVAKSSFTQTKILIARLSNEFEDTIGHLPLFPTIERNDES